MALVPLDRIICLKSLSNKDLSHLKTKLSKSRNQRGFRAFSYPTEPVPELAKKFTETAIAKMDELREKVWIKLRGKLEAENALAAVENGSQADLNNVAAYLQVAMVEDPKFASEIRALGQEINAGKLVDQSRMTQINSDQAKGWQTKVEGGTAYIGENHFHGQSPSS